MDTTWTAPTEVLERLGAYRPKSLSENDWTLVAEEAMQLVLACRPVSWAVAKALLSSLTAFLAHASATGPVAVDRLTPGSLEGYAASLLAGGETEVNVANLRSRLRRLAETRVPTKLAEVGNSRPDWREMDPYSDDELAAIRGAARELPDRDADVLLRAVVLIEGCGLGAHATATVRVAGGCLVSGEDVHHGPVPTRLRDHAGPLRFSEDDWSRVRSGVADSCGILMRRHRLRDRWVIRVLERCEPVATAMGRAGVGRIDMNSYHRRVMTAPVLHLDLVRQA